MISLNAKPLECPEAEKKLLRKEIKKLKPNYCQNWTGNRTSIPLLFLGVSSSIRSFIFYESC